MRAVVYRGREDLDITDLAEPPVGPGEVRLRVGFNGICGSDLHEYFAGPIFIPNGQAHPLTGRELPLTLGHEFSGTVVELGPGVEGVAGGDGVEGAAEGDRVAVTPLYYCGTCPACAEGRYNVCAQIGFHGLMAYGGMAETTVVPQHMLHRLPDRVSLEMGALVEPMAVAHHAAKLGDVTPDSTTG